MSNIGVKGLVFAVIVLAGDFCNPPSGSQYHVAVENLSGQDVEAFLPQRAHYRELDLTAHPTADGAIISQNFPRDVCLRGEFRMVTNSGEVVAEREVLCPGDFWQVAVDEAGGYTDSVDSRFDSVFRRRPPIDDVEGEVEREESPWENPFVENHSDPRDNER